MEDGGGEVASGKDDGGKRKRARANECNGRGKHTGAMAAENREFKKAKFKVIREVREDMKMIDRGIKFGQQIRKMRL